jgi:uncharacterized protein (UPF0212 family)
MALRELSGMDDLLLLGGGRSVPELARELLAALAGDGEAVDALPIGDAEALLLQLRASLVGEHIQGDLHCPSCRARIEISFSVSDYLRHHRPRTRSTVDESEGWLTDRRSQITFRIPTLRDQIEVSGAPQAAADLLQRCVRGETGRAIRLRVERLLDQLAPTLSGHVAGDCPECGERVEAYFDVEQFVLRELRAVAGEVYDDVHHIASAYGWSEDEILAMPRSRRTAYAERIRDGREA